MTEKISATVPTNDLAAPAEARLHQPPEQPAPGAIPLSQIVVSPRNPRHARKGSHLTTAGMPGFLSLPIILRPVPGTDQYQIIIGAERYRASLACRGTDGVLVAKEYILVGTSNRGQNKSLIEIFDDLDKTRLEMAALRRYLRKLKMLQFKSLAIAAGSRQAEKGTEA